MMQEDFAKKFKRESKSLAEIRIKSIHAQEKYDNEKAIGKDPKKRGVFELSLASIREEEEAIRYDYARKVFTLLSKEEPVLIRRRDKAEVTWVDAFGTDFEKLSPELMASIVALVEEDGGQYRIKF